MDLAIFGSYVRGENCKNSDLDLLIVLETAPRMRERLAEFVDEIEVEHEDLAQRLPTATSRSLVPVPRSAVAIPIR